VFALVQIYSRISFPTPLSILSRGIIFSSDPSHRTPEVYDMVSSCFFSLLLRCDWCHPSPPPPVFLFFPFSFFLMFQRSSASFPSADAFFVQTREQTPLSLCLRRHRHVRPGFLFFLPTNLVPDMMTSVPLLDRLGFRQPLFPSNLFHFRKSPFCFSYLSGN